MASSKPVTAVPATSIPSRQVPAAPPVVARYWKYGWAKKCGVSLSSTSTVTDITDYRPQHHVAAPGLSVADLTVTTTVKTRFLLLGEYRLRYGSTSCYEAFRRDAAPSIVSSTLPSPNAPEATTATASSSNGRGTTGGMPRGATTTVGNASVTMMVPPPPPSAVRECLAEVFLTGDAWMRAVEPTSLLLHGDSAMQKKQGKCYLLTFRSLDERVEWEFALQHFLQRSMSMERFERLLLSGWISAFPALGNRVERVRGRRMSLAATKHIGDNRSTGPAVTAAAAAQAVRLPPRRSGSAATMPRKAEEEDEEDDGVAALADVVDDEQLSTEGDDDDDDEDNSAEGATVAKDRSASSDENLSDDPQKGRLRRVDQKIRKTTSDVSSAVTQLLTHRVATGVGAAALPGGSTAANITVATTTAATDTSGDAGAGSRDTNSVVQFTKEEINNGGLPFVLRCQRSSVFLDGQLRRPLPTYLAVQWQRTTTSIHSVPTMIETTSIAHAAKFALRRFATASSTASTLRGSSSGSIPPGRLVLVDSPGWQLSHRPDASSLGVDLGERELVLGPVYRSFTQMSPVFIKEKDVDVNNTHSSSRPLATAAASSDEYDMVPAARSFEVTEWEGSIAGYSMPIHDAAAAASSFSHDSGAERRNASPHPQRANDASSLAATAVTASFSFLLQCSPATTNAVVPSHPQSGQQPPDANRPKRLVLALSRGGKLYLIPDDHPDAQGAYDDDDDSGNGGGSSPQPFGGAGGSGASFLPVEVVPMSTDRAQRHKMEHPTAGMRQRALYRQANKSGLNLSYLQERLVEPVRVVLLGATGSGKSTIAQWFRRFRVQSAFAGSGGADPSRRSTAATGSAETSSFLRLLSLGDSPPASRDVDGSSTALQLVFEQLAREVCSMQCHGICVPVVVTEVPSTATGPLIRTHCSSADIVVCVCDLSDEHSLTYLQERLPFLVAPHPLASSGEPPHEPPPPSSSSTTLTSTRYVLCATRTDCVRLAVDSYRLQEFRNEIAARTNLSERELWESRIIATAEGAERDGVPHDGNPLEANDGKRNDSFSTDASATASIAAGSAVVAADKERQSFAHFGSSWREWRIPTVNSAAAASTERSATCGLDGDAVSGRRPGGDWPDFDGSTLHDSFLLSPRLRAIASRGVTESTLRGGGLKPPGEGVLSPPSSPQTLHLPGVDFDSHVDTETSCHAAQLFLLRMSSLLEELYLIRLCDVVGWNTTMVVRFVNAVHTATRRADTKTKNWRSSSGDDDDHRHHPHNNSNNTEMPAPSDSFLGATVCGDASLSSVVEPLRFALEALQLPCSMQFQAIAEVLHLPKPRGYNPSGIHRSTMVALPPQQLSTAAPSAASADGSVTSPRLVRPSIAQRIDPLSDSLRTDLSRVSEMSGLEDDRFARSTLGSTAAAIPLLMLHPLAATSIHRLGRGNVAMDTLLYSLSSPPAHPISSPQLDHRTAGTPRALDHSFHAFGGSTPPNFPMKMLMSPSLRNSTHIAASDSSRSRPAAAAVRKSYTPSWTELVAVSLFDMEWPWLLLRWLLTGHSFGDVRVEVIYHALTCPAATCRGSASSDGRVASRASRYVKYMLGPYGTLYDITTTATAASESASRSSGNNADEEGRQEEMSDDDDDDNDKDRDGGTGSSSNSDIGRLERRGSSDGDGALVSPAYLPFARRRFHPLDLLFLSNGLECPPDSPPRLIPHAVLWIYRSMTASRQSQQQPQQTSTTATTVNFVTSPRSTGDGGGGGGAAGSSTTRHLTVPMLQTLFSWGGIDLSKDHAALILRWADSDGDRLTDATDFLRWYCALLLLSSPSWTTAASAATKREETARPRCTWSPGSFLAMVSIVWARRIVEDVSMLEALAVSLRLRVASRERSRALAAVSASLGLDARACTEFVALREAQELSQWNNSSIASPHGGSAWDAVTDFENPNPPGTLAFRAMDSTGGFTNATSLPGSEGAQTKAKKRKSCHRCQAVFRFLVRPAHECSECHERFCKNCCQPVTVLNVATARTEKRVLCGACRRCHSAAPDGFEEAGVNARRSDGASTNHSRDAERNLGSGNAHLLGGGGAGDGVPLGGGPTVLWEDDAQTTCSLCAAPFTILKRRHHCRECGALVCAACSPHMMPVRGLPGVQRVCASCKRGRDALRYAAGDEWETSTSRSSNTAATTNLHERNEAPAAANEGDGGSASASQAVSHRTRSLSSSKATPGTELGPPQQSYARRDSRASGTGGGAGSQKDIGSRSGIAEAQDRLARRRQQWATMRPLPEFELPWYETYSARDEEVLIARGRQILFHRFRIRQQIAALPGGKAALNEARGPVWSYTVHEVGYTAHDAELERCYDAAQLEELGPDVDPH